MLDVGHHGDGESLPTEALPQLEARTRTCPHCTGLLLLDVDNLLAFKCSECSRTPGDPVRAVDELESPQLFKALSGRQWRPGTGVPEASFNDAIRKFR